MKKKIIALNLCLASVFLSAQVGINTANPQENLHVNGSFRLDNTTKGIGKILTSDTNGTGTWQFLAIPKILGSMVAPIAANTFALSSQTARNLGSNISLPPGTWEVEVGVLLDVGNTRNDSYSWVKFTFTDGGASATTQSADLVGTNKLVSGSVVTISGTGGDTISFYGLAFGKVIINNTSAANKTYHLLYWGSVYKGTTRTINSLGSNIYGENYISAIKVQ